MDGKQIMALVLGAVTAGGCTVKGASDDLQAKLNELKKSPTPQGLSYVTCYETVPPMQKVVYTCPACKKQTVYERDKEKLTDMTKRQAEEVLYTVENMEFYRKGRPELMAKLSEKYGLRFSFDESGFCKHCRPSGKPKLILKVTHPDKETFSTPIESRDLILLMAFFQDEAIFHDGAGEGHYLKDEVKRLAQLLGVSP